MGRTLADIAEDEDTLDELLITLPKCGHVFTVETLDGICGMSDYYTLREDSSWLDLRTPVNDTAAGERKRPPVCPTCRTAITSPRYGRVFKSADLDILERNMISRLSGQLKIVRDMMDEISKPQLEARVIAAASTVKAEAIGTATNSNVLKACIKAQKACLENKDELPVPLITLDPGAIDLFLISPTVADAWKTVVKPLMQLYERAMKVAAMRSPHTKAWEASWSFLFEQEMEMAVADPARAPRNLDQYAMQMARRKVGQPQPRADKRFLVEAFWTTIQIRLLLVDLASSWLTSAGKNKDLGPQDLQMWAVFTSFTLQGCERDAYIAFRIAEVSETRRQMTTSLLWTMRINLEQHRLEVKLAQESGHIGEQREKLAEKALDGGQKLDTDIRRIIQEHKRVLPNDLKDWIKQNFLDIALAIHQEWQSLEKSIRCETFYEPVSLDEKMNIVKALNFSWRERIRERLNMKRWQEKRVPNAVHGLGADDKLKM
ncbi:hypothetical protein H0H87_011163 [Tephrocybe sp. NHM501043]|nr:hypothetical protein H0H87_011163 [Tephrocybe sp. NHM501043]